jgi:hypothetical protein
VGALDLSFVSFSCAKSVKPRFTVGGYLGAQIFGNGLGSSLCWAVSRMYKLSGGAIVVSVDVTIKK